MVAVPAPVAIPSPVAPTTVDPVREPEPASQPASQTGDSAPAGISNVDNTPSPSTEKEQPVPGLSGAANDDNRFQVE